MLRPSIPAALVLLAGCTPVSTPARTPFSVGAVLSDVPGEGFERAIEPRAFVFPADHGPHEGFRTEWWYFTGNLSGDDGRRFGFQLTFFRSALAPHPPANESAWAARDVWMAHLALTDVRAGRFHAFERFERGALGLAGARAEPLAVWTGPWRVEAITPEAFPLRLRAEHDDVALDLVLAPAKAPVLHGERGLSRKGAQPGNASYYYSLTRIDTRGLLRVDGAQLQVQGSSWLDREWSTSALEPDQVGWDWIALQLDDGRELMAYRLRRADGSTDPHSAGTLVDSSGGVQRLWARDLRLRALDRWRSPSSGVTYPSRWRLEVPGEGLDLELRPVIAAQELDLAFRYWEGAVEVAGSQTGRGYVELVGYGAETGD